MGFAALSVAQTTDLQKPEIKAYNNGYIFAGISPNGKYALYESRVEDEKSGGMIVNIATGEEKVITAANEGATDTGKASDITNDASIAVGTYEELPAYWTSSTGLWTNLSTSDTAVSGEVFGVSADGHYAVGREFFSQYVFSEVLWDLTTGQKVTLNNVPKLDLAAEYMNENQFNNISADGRYILGVVDYCCTDQQNYYVYDRQTETYDYIGFTYTNKVFLEKVDNLHHIDAATMSPNGYYVTGQAYMTDNTVCTFRYNVLTKEFEVFNTDLDSGIMGTAIDDNGNVYGATPVADPQRELYVRSGKYWYSMENILTQCYGIDFADKTGLDYTGTPVAVSPDGRFIGAFSNPEDGNGCNYTFYQDVQEICKSVDLMGTYTVSPANQACFSTISSVTVSFDRDVQLLGAVTSAQLLNADGTLVRNSMGINVEGSLATITFRPTTLEAEKTYTVLLPAGTFAMATDAEVQSKDIKISYVGRSNTPVAATVIYPTPGSAVSKFDYSSSNILAYFNANIKLVEGAKALVYRNDETDAYEEMTLYCSGSGLAIYPTSTLYLFSGNTYKIVVPAGSITDVGGSGKNEELVINYTGNYVREISTTDKILFSEDFSSGLGTQLMFYEGDNLTPNSEMQDYGFTASSTPWWVGSDDQGDDPGNYAAMSTSAYTTSGKSDDWMVIPSLYLPDENCHLDFKTQGFRKSCQDRLSVYIIPSSKVYNTLSDEAMTELRANKVLLYNEVVNPGDSEDLLANDWTNVQISLSDYAGKDVYIAFVNENQDQSIVFVDDIEVIHEMNYLIDLYNETTVVNQSAVSVYGCIEVQNETCSYTEAHLELRDSDDNIVDTIDATDIVVDKDHKYEFAFNKQLPVKVGIENNFTIVVKMGSDAYNVSRTITDLAFQPTKRVFLEEYAGATCVNCPTGILAMEKLEADLPNNFIGVTIRTYDNDELSSNLSGYSDFLGFTAAPTAMINRKVIAAPMDQLNGSYVFSNPSNMLWSDIVYSELETPAVADISVSASVDEAGEYVSAPVTVKYALDKNDVNVSLLLVVVEDNIKTYQCNKFNTLTDPNLGEWGAGGIYGKATVRNYYISDIARAVVGLTYNGTQGYVPTSVVAGEENVATITFPVPQIVSNMDNARVVAVMIDNNTDYVINAAECRIATAGVNDVVVADNNIDIDVDADGNVVVDTDTEAAVAVYSLSGALVANTYGSGTLVANTRGYKGVAIARVVTANSSKIVKLIIK
jgi:hypothetical protein